MKGGAARQRRSRKEQEIMANSRRQASSTEVKPAIFCDFDGTITQLDVTDQILTQLAHPSWREIEQEWMLGLIGSRECLERQMALVDAPIKELNAVIDAIPIDPEFAAFCRFAQRQHIPVYILSDGFDYVIRRVLKRVGLERQFQGESNLFASSLQVDGRRLETSFPYPAKPCAHGCATCKVALIERLRADFRPVIFVGDGMSDRFAVDAADFIFAKRHLLAHCRESGIACHAFDTFKDVQNMLKNVLDPTPARRLSEAAVALS